MKALTRESILKVKPKLLEVSVPEWDGPIYVRKMSVLESVELLDSVLKMPTAQQLVEIVLTYSSNEKGAALFKEEDRDWLETQTFETLNTITDSFFRHNNLIPEEAKEKDEQLKNS